MKCSIMSDIMLGGNDDNLMVQIYKKTCIGCMCMHCCFIFFKGVENEFDGIKSLGLLRF